MMLEDKVAVVTGSARGIGAATVKLLSQLRRLGEPEDIAGAVLFYCVDWSRFVTGTYLPACGGAHMP